jgi:hypothetical protein
VSQNPQFGLLLITCGTWFLWGMSSV